MSKTQRLIFWILLLLLSIALLVPFFYTVSFSIPGSDDFSTGFVTRINQKESLFAKAVDIANTSYMTWGGSWTGAFLQVILDPLNFTADYLNCIGIEMVCFFALFVAVFILLVDTLIKCVFSCDNALLRASVVLCSLASVLFSEIYYDVFYWFTGSCYNWYLCFSMLFIIFTLREMYGRSSVLNSVAMFFFGILACQNMIMDVSVGIVTLFVIIWGIKNGYPHTKMMVLLLVLMILSGCSSVFSPGNLARYGDEAGSIDYFWSFKHSILECLDELKFLLLNRSLYVIFAAIFCLGTKLRKNVCSLKSIALLMILAGLSAFGIIFPVDIGYRGTYIPNRIRFAFDVILELYLIVILLMLGSAIKDWAMKKRWFFVALTVASVVLLVTGNGYKNNAYYRTVTHAEEARIESGEYKKIFREIENSNDDDVVIVINASAIPHSGVIALPNISDKTWFPVNHAVAGYYGKNTIKFEWV